MESEALKPRGTKVKVEVEVEMEMKAKLVTHKKILGSAGLLPIRIQGGDRGGSEEPTKAYSGTSRSATQRQRRYTLEGESAGGSCI
jgi:hypothetical protein